MGEIVESGPVDYVVVNPQYAYVKILVDSVPKADPENKWKEQITLEKTIQSSQYGPTKGCKFYSRCPNHMDKCMEKKLRLIDLEDDHRV